MTLIELVEEVRAIPYGRAAGHGTCSSKHYLLRDKLAQLDPPVATEVMHRVYRLDKQGAAALFGPGPASRVPDEGLTDVHTYLRVTVDGANVTIDVTYPRGGPWDGRSSMPLWCGDGTDVPGGDDPGATKAALVAEYCDPAVREPFIAALS